MRRVTEKANEDDLGSRVVVQGARNCFCVSRDMITIQSVVEIKSVAFSTCGPVNDLKIGRRARQTSNVHILRASELYEDRILDL